MGQEFGLIKDINEINRTDFSIWAQQTNQSMNKHRR